MPALFVSEDKVTVQRGGQAYLAVSAPTKPNSLTRISMASFPEGVVSVSDPYTILPGTNETEILTITYVARGSATVRISASAPDDVYDGVEYDVLATAMPGFIFLHSLIQQCCQRISNTFHFSC